jgi:hypothetical protein
MAEKVKIKSCVFKREGINKSGEPYKSYEIELEDGRKGNSFAEFLPGEECEIEIKVPSDPKYLPNFSKVQAKKFGTKDYAFEKKRVALECAVSLINSGKIPFEKLVEARDKFFEYLK